MDKISGIPTPNDGFSSIPQLNKIAELKKANINKYCKVKLLQFIDDAEDETLQVDVGKIYIDLACEPFKFNYVNSVKTGITTQSVESCSVKFSYNNLCRDAGKSIVILGLPGAGKSTLLKYLFEMYSKEELVIPIYVELKQEDRLGGFKSLWDIGENVTLKHIQGYLKNYFEKALGADCAELLNYVYQQQYQFVFFCDGLDEISKSQYENFRKTVNVSNEFTNIHYIISSRQVNFRRSDYRDQFKLYSLMDFDIERQREFIEKYFNVVQNSDCNFGKINRHKGQLLKLLDTSSFIQRMAKSPILLSLLCVTPNLDTIRNKSQIFQNAISVLLNNRDIKDDEDKRLFIDFLKQIAVVFFKLDKAESFDADELNFYADKFFCSQDDDTCSRLKGKYLDCGLFEQIDCGNSKIAFKFAHRTIWEYLVAEGMATESETENIYSRANMSIWEEPIKMWVTLITERSKLNISDVFGELWKRNKALTLTCMNEFDPFPNIEFNSLYNGLSKRDKLRLIATLRDSYINPSTDYRKQAINTIQETLKLIHSVERDCEIIYAYLEFLEEFKEEQTFSDMLADFLDYAHLEARQKQMQELGLEFSLVAPGTFLMGRNHLVFTTEDERNKHINVDAEETPAHYVRITKPYKISKTLITNKMFYDSGFPYISKSDNVPAFKGNSYSESPNQPVNYVNWYEAMVFAKWLGCTLASEAEWEYACRGGEHNNDYMTNVLADMIEQLDKVACYASRNIGHPNKTRPVLPIDKNRSNSLGLVDMLGNLREWCIDWYSDDFYEKCCVSNYPSFKNDIKGKETITYYFDCDGTPKIVEDRFSKVTDLFTFDKEGNCLDPVKKIPGKFEAKCLRGGCFDWNESNLRPTYRNHNPANNVYKVNGFRLVYKEF